MEPNRGGTFILEQKLLRCEIDFTISYAIGLIFVYYCDTFKSNTNTLTTHRHVHEISGNGLYSQKLPFTKEQTRKQTSNRTPYNENVTNFKRNNCRSSF